MERRLLCAARGRDGDWEGICLDLDIAVQGDSFDEVKTLLHKSIATYLEDAEKEDADTRARLLSRRVPLLTRLKYVLGFAIHSLSARDKDSGLQASFEIPCHA